MTQEPALYEDDLAYIHDVGFNAIAEGCAPGLLAILREAGIDSGVVIDVGCGGGYWAEQLAASGYSPTGIDISPAMISIAQQRLPGAEFRVASVWDAPLSECRAITAISEVLCYRGSPDDECDLDALLQKMFASLAPGGLLLFDVVGLGVDRDRSQAFWERDDWACLVQYDFDDERMQLQRHITTFRKVGDLYRRSFERHIVQQFDVEDVAEKLKNAGFVVRTTRRLGDFELLPGRTAFIAQKPAGA